MRFFAAFVVVAALLSAQPPLYPIFRGTLKNVDKKEIRMENEDRDEVVMLRTHKTRFLDKGKAIHPEQITPGTPISVEVTKDPGRNLVAVNVYLEHSPAK